MPPLYGGRGLISNRRMKWFLQLKWPSNVIRGHRQCPPLTRQCTYEFLIIIPLQQYYVHILYSIEFCHFKLVFLSHGDAVRTIALNFAWTERHCHACKTPRSMYPSSYNSFPVIRTTIAKKIVIFTYPGLLSLPWGRPCGNRAKRCMNEKTIQCLPNPSQHVPIYLQQFPSYSNR